MSSAGIVSGKTKGLVKPESLYQPAKLWPSLSGSVGAVSGVPYFCVIGSIGRRKKLIVYVFGSHLAYKVMSSVTKSFSKSQGVSYSASLNQPMKSWPVFTGSSGLSRGRLYKTSAASTALPPSVSKVTVYLFRSQLPSKMISSVMGVSKSKISPSKSQATKVKPVLWGVSGISNFSLNFTVTV